MLSGPSSTIGRYRLEGELGRGGMAIVYRALDPQLGRPVAIKVMQGGPVDRDWSDRFEREMRAMAALSHPNVVRVFDSGVDAGRPYIVTELIPGMDLDRILAANGAQPIPKVLQTAASLLEALVTVHASGILHRDIKPSNVMIAPDGRAVLMDFGLVLVGSKGRLTATGLVVGTPAYMPPECLSGRKSTERSDLFQLGLLVYEMLAGHPLFQIEDVDELLGAMEKLPPDDLESMRPDLPAPLARWLRRALMPDPADRYGSAGEMLQAMPGGSAMTQAVRSRVDPRERARRPGLAGRAQGLDSPQAKPESAAVAPEQTPKAPQAPPAPTSRSGLPAAVLLAAVAAGAAAWLWPSPARVAQPVLAPAPAKVDPFPADRVRSDRVQASLNSIGGVDPATGLFVEPDRDPVARRDWIARLARSGDPRALLALAQAAARDADPSVRQAAAGAVVKLTAGALPVHAVELWGRIENWLRRPFEERLSELSRRGGGLDLAAAKAGFDLEAGLEAITRGDAARGRTLILRSISLNPSGIWGWRALGRDLLRNDGRFADAAAVANLTRHAGLDSDEWDGLESAYLAQTAGLPEIAAWICRAALGHRVRRTVSIDTYREAMFETALDANDVPLLLQALGSEPDDSSYWRRAIAFASRWAPQPLLGRLQGVSVPKEAKPLLQALETGEPAALEAAARGLARESDPHWQLALAALARSRGRADLALEALERAVAGAPVLAAQRTRRRGGPWAPSLAANTRRLRIALCRETGRLADSVDLGLEGTGDLGPAIVRWRPLLEAIEGAGAAAAPLASRITAARRDAEPAEDAGWREIALAAVSLEAGEASTAIAQVRAGARMVATQTLFDPALALAIEARAAERLEDTTAARRLWRLAAAAPDCVPVESRLFRARAAHLQGDTRAAFAWLGSALALDPHDWQALSSLALWCAEPGERPALLKHALESARSRLDARAVPAILAVR